MAQTLLSRIARGATKAAGKVAGVSVLSYGYDPSKVQRTSANDSPERLRQQILTQQMESLLEWGNNTSRLLKNRDYREMAQDVPELAAAIKIQNKFAFVGDTVSGDLDPSPLTTVFADDARPEVKECLLELQELLDPNTLLRPLSEAADTFGDNFTNVVYERAPEFRLPNGQPGYRIASVNELGEDNVSAVPAPGGRVAYYLVSPPGTSPLMGGSAYARMEIVHWARARKANHRYGTSLLESARKIWTQDSAAQDVTSLLTLLRAAQRKSVAVPIGGMVNEDDIEKWREKYALGLDFRDILGTDGTLRRQVLSATQLEDLVYPYTGDKAPTFHDEPGVDLRILIALLQYYQERYFVATDTPAGLASLERNVNASATLEQQSNVFVKTVQDKQSDINRLWIEIGDRALVARGITPKRGEYRLRMPMVRRFDSQNQARAERLKAETAKMQIELGLQQQYVLNRCLGIPQDQMADAIASKPTFLNTDGTSGQTLHKAEPWDGREDV